MRELWVKRAHGVLHGVLRAVGRDHHGVAAHGVGVRNVRARLEVRAVAHGHGQPRAYIADRLKLHHPPKQVRLGADVALHVVEQRVEPLVRRELWRHAQHELRVNDRDSGEVVGRADADLLVRVELGHHADGVDLGPRARRGGDGDPRKLGPLERQVPAGASRGVVPQVAGRLRGKERHHLGRVHNRAAAERDHEVHLALAGERRTLLHHLLRGVRADAVEQHRLHAGPRELVHRAVEVAVRARGAAVGYHEHGRLARHGLLVQVGELAGAKQDAGGCIEAEAV